MTFYVDYDQEVDAAYFRIENKTVLDSEEIADGIIVDYDKDDNIVGVELLGVKTIKPENFALLIPLLPESFYAKLLDKFQNDKLLFLKL
ncbi:DUF2283 domain-containing protein [Aphanothece sacrum]|uniref:DUF2283 domain-containing protein n=1 Tax=Aphanothece sacrum FPU1 TaxID=1920663 RepID=A0A401IHZ3_APHSA|nr:DUF2283 domain-containing protein [Aphanothece sacrum]GBF80849.1 hypothetical protein AsFPU1_2256 [Aphanothece sacrum FPU1]GBF85635.1 hypothetical protein AsFPU3_2699 [Aphanothece sacrum FPU3]